LTADTPLLIVGRITKPFGLKGDVVVLLTTTEHDRVAAGSILETDRGSLTVKHSRPHQDRFVVLFEGTAGRSGAEALRGLELRAAATEGDDELWAHKLIGLSVHELSGQDRGKVVSLHVNPASDLLELEDGRLVPLRFVTGVADGVIHVDVPDGLFEV
jgi:16S rRNA processing protein RimM